MSLSVEVTPTVFLSFSVLMLSFWHLPSLCFSLYPWLKLSNYLSISPRCSPHPSDDLPSFCPLLLSSLPLLFYLIITGISSPPLIGLTHAFLLVMLFVFPLSFLSHFLLPRSSPISLFLLSYFLSSFYLFTYFPFSITLLLLMVLGNVHQAYWHRLVVDEFRRDYTHTHTHTHKCVRACAHRPVGDGGWWAMPDSQHLCPSELLKKPH